MSAGNKGRLLFGIGLLASLPALWVAQPYLVRDSFTVCTFRAMTGYRCPLCGMTRAVASALRGEFQTAFDCHPLWPVAAVLIVGFGAMLVRDAVAGTTRAERAAWLVGRAWLPIVVLLVVAAVWRAL